MQGISHLNTLGVADHLGTSIHRIVELIRTRKITPPPKDGGGRYCWFPDDVERARLALGQGRQRKGGAA